MSDQYRKTVVTKSISRKIQTAKYENIQISVNIQEEIEWNSMDEKMKKHEAVTKILIKDYENTESKVLKELDLAYKPASIGGVKNNIIENKPIDLDN